MNAHQRHFCRDAMLERGEPLPGAAGVAQAKTLLVAWPHGKWRVPRYESRDMSPVLAEAVRQSMLVTRHPVVLVDRRLSDEPVPALFSIPDGVAVDAASDEELATLILKAGRGEAVSGRKDERLVILVCTDGRRDPCCARWGFETYKTLLAQADPARFNILEATHLGGCRLAASLTVQPTRERYGRLTPEQVPEFLATLSRGESYLPALRGRGGVSQAAMVAEIAALNWAAERGIPQSAVVLAHTDYPKPEPETAPLEVPVLVDGSPVIVRLESTRLTLAGNCETLAEDGGEPTSRWTLSAINGIQPTTKAKSGRLS